MKAALAILAALLLAGCEAWHGHPQPRAIFGTQAYQRHQFGPMAGVGVHFPGGADVKAVYQPLLGDGSGSSREAMNEVLNYQLLCEWPIP